GKDLPDIYKTPHLLFMVTTTVLIVGTLISGMYPAFILSGIKPSKNLVNTRAGKTNLFRTGLVAFQYVVSVVLIICSIIIFRQLNFMQHADLGFSASHKMVVNAPSVYHDSSQQRLFTSFRNELLKNPQIENVSASSAIPGKFYLDLDSRGGIRMAGADENSGGSYTSYRIDEQYFDTYGLKIIAGQAFSPENTADNRGLAINESALKLLGFSSPEEAIGKKIRWQRDDLLLPIINVFQNYHHKSLRHAFEPTILWNFIPNPLYYTIKFKVNSESATKELVANTKDNWDQIFTSNPFQYFFFDDQYNAQYDADLKLGKTVLTFSILAIFIACLGLFGLTTYVISSRTKEIGIRKVLGASASGIVILLTTKFMRIVGTAFLISIPIAFFISHKWLENFAFKIAINAWIFVGAGAIAMLIALFSVSIQSFRAAIANPIESLKDE
ncbi:MAG: ABC transporter permease, partial [Saprospiraceae bacterium]|nr:ABC transporter permease [Saprospiraceae bacterium]